MQKESNSRGVLGKIIFVIGRQYLSRYFLLGSLMLSAALLETLSVGLVLPFLAALGSPEIILANKYVAHLFDYMGLPKTGTKLVMVSGVAMILIAIVKNGASFFVSRQQSRLLFLERAAIARKLFDHYIHMPYSRHLNKNMASLIQVTVGVSTNFSTVYMSAILTIAAETLVTLSLVALLFTVSPIATGTAIGFITVIGAGYALATRVRTLQLGHQSHELAVAVNQCLIEGLSALKEMRIFGAAPQFLRRFDSLADEYTKAAVRTQVFGQIPRLLIETTFVVSVVVAVMYFAQGGGDFNEILPILAMFGVAFLRMLPSYNRILLAITSLRLNYSALSVLHDELQEVIGSSADQESSLWKRELDHPFRTLQLKNVRYRYPGTQVDALQDITLNVDRHQSAGLVGKSGSGKTTLVDVILGLLVPNAGRVEINGLSVSTLRLAGLVGYIPQHIYLTDDTIRRNIAFGVDDQDIQPDALQEAVRAAQLDGFIASLPKGLDTKVGDRGVRLSGGQRQRLGIARALYRNPEILIMDEATSALDIETELAVTDAIKRLGRHKTLIVIAHRLSTVKDCDTLYLMEEGRVIEQGTYAELAKKSEWFGKVSEMGNLIN